MGAPSRPRKRTAPREAAHARGAATAEAIAQAVGVVVAAHGVRGLTTRAVAKTAGVGMGSLYQFFPTREALIVAWEERVFAREMAAATALLVTSSAEEAPLPVVTLALIRAAVQMFRNILAAYGPDGDAQLVARFAVRDRLATQFEEILVSVFEHSIPGSIRPVRRRIAARLMIRTVSYLAYDLALMPIESEAEYLDELGDMIARYLWTGQSPV